MSVRVLPPVSEKGPDHACEFLKKKNLFEIDFKKFSIPDFKILFLFFY